MLSMMRCCCPTIGGVFNFQVWHNNGDQYNCRYTKYGRGLASVNIDTGGVLKTFSYSFDTSFELLGQVDCGYTAEEYQINSAEYNKWWNDSMKQASDLCVSSLLSLAPEYGFSVSGSDLSVSFQNLSVSVVH